MSDNTDEPLLEVSDGAAPDDENKPKKPKKAKAAKLKDAVKRATGTKRLSDGDIGSIAPTEAESAKNLASLTATSPLAETPEETNKKDIEKTVTEQKAAERKAQLENLGINEEEKHKFNDKVKLANDKYKKSGFGKAADRLGKNMKTVGAGVEGMTEQALLETALYNMLMLLFELLFGAKKGIKKLPEGVKWLNANRKREHLYSGAMRRYAKEDHGKALKDADGLKKDIEALKKEREDLKKEKADIAKKNEGKSAYGPEDSARLQEIEKRLNENKAETKEKQGKYDAAMLSMAKAENTFQKHGDATKNEKWQKAMKEYKELLPKLAEARDKYKADKQIVKDTPVLLRDAKKAELKLDEQKVALGNLKQKELDLYGKIEKLEKSIGKTSAELAELQNVANNRHPEGIEKARDKAKKLDQLVELGSQEIESSKKGEGLANTKLGLEKEQKEIKEAQSELKRIPDTDKTPEEKEQKAALDKRAAEIKGKLTNLDGKKATLEMARDKAQAKLDNFGKLTQEQKDKKIAKDPTFEQKIKDELKSAEENLAKYEKQGKDLTDRKAELDAKIESHPNLPEGDKKKTLERLEKLKNQRNRVEGQISKYNAESSGQIAQNKIATDQIQDSINNITKQIEFQPPKLTANVASKADEPILSVTNPTTQPDIAPTTAKSAKPLPDRPKSAAPILSTTASVPSPSAQTQQQAIFATSAEPPKIIPAVTSTQTLGAMVDKYAKMDHPVPQEQLMSRFQSLMIEGAMISQQNSMRDFLAQNPRYNPSSPTNVDSLDGRTRSLEMIFAKAYLDHLKSHDSNVRNLSPEQVAQVKAIAKVAANDPETTSMLKASAQQKLDAKIQALTTGATSAEPKPQSVQVSMAGDLAIADKDKVKGKDDTDTRKKTGASRH